MRKSVVDAVEYFKGKWPYGEPSIICNIDTDSYSDWRSSSDSELNKNYWYFVCTHEEFEQEVERQKLEQASTDWYDYDKQEAISLPPVGTKCAVYLDWSGSWSQWVRVVGYDAGGIIWGNGSDTQSYRFSPKDKIRPLDWNRKQTEQENIRTETVDAISAELNHLISVATYENFILLYDKGIIRPISEWPDHA